MEKTKEIFRNPDYPRSDRVDNLMNLLTLEEKIKFLYHVAEDIPRLGIKHYYHGNEALHGVVRPGKATVFPQAIAFGATWDPDLILKVATVISDEARMKHHNEPSGEGHSNGLLTFWSPTVNMVRDPRWGRTPETYGEDVHLTSRIGVSFVKGLQGTDPNYLKVVSTPKHYTANNEEHNRFSCNPKIPLVHVREYFLPQFKALIVEGKARSIMSAYNRVLGVPCSASKFLLTDVLRDEWKFDGYVVTDCGAVWFMGPFQQKYVFLPVDGAAASINAGVDLECGDVWKKSLIKAFKKGKVSEETINRAVRNVLRAYFDLGMFDPQERVPYSKLPYEKLGCKDHSDLAYEVAVKSMVLLKNGDKNDGTKMLPLDTSKIKKIAVIGPNSAHPIFGDYSGIPVIHAISPLEGIKEKFKDSEVLFVPWISPKDMGKMRNVSKENLKPKENCPKVFGLKMEIFSEVNFKGSPTILTDQNPTFNWKRKVDATVSNAFSSSESKVTDVPRVFSMRFSGFFTPDFTNEYTFEYKISSGAKPIFSFDGIVGTNGKLQAKLEKGKSYKIQIEIPKLSRNAVGSLMYSLPKPETNVGVFELEEEAAKDADVVIAFIGIDTNTEREGKDKESLEFPKEQIDMLKRVVKVNKNTIGIVISGSPLELGYLHENLAALIQAWYPGERGGDAIAALLAGDQNFSGKLPMTFFKSTSQLPPLDDYELFNGRTYMYFDGEPQYEFGYGLSYNSFKFEHFSLKQSKVKIDGMIEYSIDIENQGEFVGEEIIQCYIKYIEAEKYSRAKLRLPNKQLKDFKRIKLNPNEKITINGVINVKSIEFFDLELNSYLTLPGKIEIQIGNSSKSIVFKESVDIIE